MYLCERQRGGRERGGRLRTGDNKPFFHLSAVCWSALCLATAVETDTGRQEVEHLELPIPGGCVCV